MKTHTKKNYLKKKKKKSISNDNALIISLITFLTVVVVVISALGIYISYSASYVAKVDGVKIYSYEYQTFLDKALKDQYDKMPKANEATTPTADDVNKYFTTPKEDGKTPYDVAKEEAMRLAKNFKASSIIAKKAGVSLTSDEKKQYENYINNYIMQYSSQGVSESAITGGLSKKDYIKFALDNAQIEKYKKDKILPTISPTEEELTKYYSDNEAIYRTLSVKVLFASKTDAAGTELSAEDLAKKEADVQTWLTEINSGAKTFDEQAKLHSDETNVKDKAESIYKFNKVSPEIQDTELVDEILKIKDVHPSAVLFKTKTGSYIIQCVKIETFAQSDDQAIRTEVETDYKAKIAQENLDKDAENYQYSNKKQKNIDKIFAEVTKQL